MISFGAFAATDNSDIVAGKQYSVLKNVKSPDKELVEVFSFNCPSCYNLDVKAQGGKVIASQIDKDITMRKYHLDSFGPLAPELSQAWAIANVLGMQDAVANDLYKGIHETRSIRSPADIEAVFVNFGVDNEQYQKMKSNFMVRTFMKQQSDVIKELGPRSIPSFFVNRLYLINPQGLNQTSTENMLLDYVRITNYLANKD